MRHSDVYPVYNVENCISIQYSTSTYPVWEYLLNTQIGKQYMYEIAQIAIGQRQQKMHLYVFSKSLTLEILMVKRINEWDHVFQTTTAPVNCYAFGSQTLLTMCVGLCWISSSLNEEWTLHNWMA